jgi:hypothetical protein
MIGRALDYRSDIDDFVGRTKDLRTLELDEEEWAAITQVARWLNAFREATTQMSATKHSSVLATTHGIFRGLQHHLVKILSNLPASIPLAIKQALIDSHLKLSEYYTKFDQSPLYTWAACKSLGICRCDVANSFYTF